MRPYQSYQRINISTADPLKIVIMLYEGAIKNLNQAMRLHDKGDSAAGAKIGRALDIVNYLRNALDHEKGEAIAENLERLYDYMRDALNHANINRDNAKIEEVMALLQTLLEGWRGIASGTTTEHDTANPTNPSLPSSGLSMVG